MMREPQPYRQWPADHDARWIEAADTFGYHLMLAARDYAFERIPASVSDEAQALARQAALDAVYGVMMLLDGIPSNRIDPDHRVQYVLSARIRDRMGTTLEVVELAPAGDGLCMGYHGWVQGDFGGEDD